MFDPRAYQHQAVADVEREFHQGRRRVILSMPTGSGKTYTAARLIHDRAVRGEHSLFVVDRVELVFHAVETLQRLGLQVGVLQGENTDMRPADEVTVASIQTIRARGVGFANFIVIDEVHILHRAHIQLLKDLFWIPTLGLSATPLRKDLGKYFESLVRGPSVRELMASGALVSNIHAYCPSHKAMRRILEGVRTRGGDFIEGDLSKAVNRKELVGDIVGTWKAKASDRQTLCFAVDIAHSKSIVEDFQTVGVRAEHLDCHTAAGDRRRIIQAFRDHEIQVLSSVNVLGIGFDVPSASCGILARPTLSQTLDMQQKGRLLRPADGKSDALLLDHAGNTLRFGLPQDFVVPDLGSEKHTSTKAARKQREGIVCRECSYILEPSQMTCPACGLDRPSRKASVHHIDGRLVEYGQDESEEQPDTETLKQNWYLALLWFARHTARRDGQPYSDGWAYQAYLEKFGSKPPWSWRELTPLVPNQEQTRWLKYYRIKQAKRFRKQRRHSNAS